MDLFPKKQKKHTDVTVAHTDEAQKKNAKAAQVNDGRLQTVLKAPWFSEKALIMTEAGVYTFSVPAQVTKTDIARAMKEIFNVTPRKVNMVNLPAKKRSLRTKRGEGVRARRHKAYVYLKKGETITLA